MGTDAQANWEEVSWKGPMKGAQSASSGGIKVNISWGSLRDLTGRWA